MQACACSGERSAHLGSGPPAFGRRRVAPASHPRFLLFAMPRPSAHCAASLPLQVPHFEKMVSAGSRGTGFDGPAAYQPCAFLPASATRAARAGGPSHSSATCCRPCPRVPLCSCTTTPSWRPPTWRPSKSPGTRSLQASTKFCCLWHPGPSKGHNGSAQFLAAFLLVLALIVCLCPLPDRPDAPCMSAPCLPCRRGTRCV